MEGFLIALGLLIIVMLWSSWYYSGPCSTSEDMRRLRPAPKRVKKTTPKRVKK